MNTRNIRILVGLAAFFFAALLVASGGAASPVHAQEKTVKVTVKVTDGGFDPAVVELDQGASVELTFVWAHVAHLQEEHVMVIPGYKLEAAKIDATHREATVKFVAAQSGTFDFKCDLECDTHDSLQNGQIKVKPSSGGASVQLVPSKLIVDPVNGVLIRGNTVAISTTLKGEDGQPIPRAEIHFYAQQEFLGRSGLVEIGVAKTLPNGYASVLYHPTTNAPRTLVAKFAGVGLYGATEQQIPLTGSDQFVSRVDRTNDDDTLHGLKGAARLSLVVVIGGVWVAFGFMVYQALGIRRAAGGGETG